MKKLALVLAIVLAVASLAFTVSAEYVSVNDNKITVTYDKATAGSYYAIIAVEGIVEEGTAPTITEDTIQYIDQVTATGTTVTFADFLLKIDYEEATLYLGGSDLDKPVLLGYVNKKEDGKIEVNFVVNSNAAADGIAIKLIPASGAPIDLTTEGGKIEAEDGVYDIKVSKKYFLSYTKKGVKLSELSEPLNVELVAGDADGNEAIDIVDLNAVLSNFGGDEENTDFDENGSVDIVDLNTVLTNFGETETIEE